MDYMYLAVRCSRKAVKRNHLLTIRDVKTQDVANIAEVHIPMACGPFC